MRPKKISMHSAVNARARANDKINILNDFREKERQREDKKSERQK